MNHINTFSKILSRLGRVRSFLTFLVMYVIVPITSCAMILAAHQGITHYGLWTRTLVILGTIVYLTLTYGIVLAWTRYIRKRRQAKLLRNQPLAHHYEVLNILADASFVLAWFAMGLICIGPELCPDLDRVMVTGWTGTDISLSIWAAGVALGIAGEATITAIVRPTLHLRKRALSLFVSGVLIGIIFPTVHFFNSYSIWLGTGVTLIFFALLIIVLHRAEVSFKIN